MGSALCLSLWKWKCFNSDEWRAALLNPHHPFTETNTPNIQTHHVLDTLLTGSLDLVCDLSPSNHCKEIERCQNAHAQVNGFRCA